MKSMTRKFTFVFVSLLLASQLALPETSEARNRRDSEREETEEPNSSPSSRRRIFTYADAAETDRDNGAAMVTGSVVTQRILLARKVRAAVDEQLGTPLLEHEFRPRVLTDHDIRRAVRITRLKTHLKNGSTFPKLGPVIEIEFDEAHSQRIQAQENALRLQQGPKPPADADLPPFRSERNGIMGYLENGLSNQGDELRPGFKTKKLHLLQHGKRGFAQLENELKALRADGAIVRSIRLKNTTANVLGRAIGVVGTTSSLGLLGAGASRLINAITLYGSIFSSTDGELAQQEYLTENDEKPGLLDVLGSSAKSRAYAIEQENQGGAGTAQ
ncbi:MAG: hypothetical protein NDJ90_04175 [Oligoflexia bacterium]|nr:hypothetical protein [Oligoflexia bacterium]